MKRAVLCVIVACAPVMSAQTSRDSVSLTSALAIDRVAARLAASGETGQAFEKRSGMSVVESRRVRDGSVEVHDAWMDVTYVQSGRATLLTGGRVAGAMTVASAGEHRGGQILGGTARALAAGDVVVVPAGVPHQFRVATGDSIRYITVKVPK
jgi:mannose-6-phosphate isomerase-like protein (cupin superfamily)